MQMAGTKKNKGSKQKKPSKRGKGRAPSQRDADAPLIEDERFAAASNRPQFRVSSSKSDSASGLLVGGSGSAKVEIDERFAAALTDPRFQIGGETGDVDKYGRKKKKKKKKKKTNDELDKYYTVAKKESPSIEDEGDIIETDSNSSSSDETPTEIERRISRQKNTRSAGDSDESSSSDSGEDSDADGAKESMRGEGDADGGANNANDPAARIAYLTALSRGEIEASSSSDESSTDDDSDASSESEESDSEDSLGRAGVLDPSTKQANEEEVEITDEPSPYLAVCNMDWSAVRAVDILGILSSFSPPGSVVRVRVYPSDFGMERIKKEEIMGPQGIWKKSKGKKSERSDDEDDGEVEEALSDGCDDSCNSDVVASDDDDYNIDDTYHHFPSNPNSDTPTESDFDPEKLRAYEASKMKYYFAVAEFTSPEAADAVYKEVDGMEVGHSSAMIDLRSIPPSSIDSVVKDREIRDECDAMPSNYEPPDFVVAALQQTAVRCTWEDGDAEREAKLTQYGVGNEAWAALTEGDDLKAYLASEGSSEEDSDSDENGVNARGKSKGAKMRTLLGLGSDDEGGNGAKDEDISSEKSVSESDADYSSEEEDDEAVERDVVKEVTYIPGKKGLDNKIRSKLESKKAGETKELTPWEKYQLKRKEKRKERRRAVRSRRKDKLADESGGCPGVDGMYGEDPEFGVPDSDDEDRDDRDNFFLGEESNSKKKSKGKHRKGAALEAEDNGRAPSTKEELELLVAGDNDEEAERDFDMRGIVRMEKVKGKKLKGSRKRKEADLAADVSGTDFRIDTTDTRFAAVLEGNDERFGIDRTDPSYKDTPAMQAVLAEQSRRRKAKKRAKTAGIPDVSADAVNKADVPSGGALALSSLVKSLKTKVAKSKK